MAVALLTRPRVPRLSLGWLMAAALLPDLVWPGFLLAGLERVEIVPGSTAFTPLVFPWYPWSHSLAAAVAWGAVLAAAGARGDRPGMAVLIALSVSHWVLDVVTHAADMPFWPGSGVIGLGLWNSLPASLLVEGGLWAAAVVRYWKARRPRPWVFGALVVLVTVIWASSPFGPPPPSAGAIAGAGFALWLVPFWAGWAEGDLQARPGFGSLDTLQ